MIWKKFSDVVLKSEEWRAKLEAIQDVKAADPTNSELIEQERNIQIEFIM